MIVKSLKSFLELFF